MTRLSSSPWLAAIAGVVVGVAIGAGFTSLIGGGSDVARRDAAPDIVRDISSVATMPVAQAEAHRADRYARISTIEATLALPGDFAQTEALYVLAGRSDSATVQDLIDQANRIADPTDRDAALSILFLRLAEIDPESALTMARMPTFTRGRRLEANIWRTWSKLDLDAALAAAAGLPRAADRNFAAQVMLAAHGYTGNAVTARIERELDVRPSAESRARYILSVADRSVPDAFAAIDGLPHADRQQAMQWLAGYLGQRDPAQALGYARLIDDPMLRRTYEGTISLAVAQQDPERILSAAQPAALQGEAAGRYFTAMRTLAEQDVDKALAYFERIESPQVRQAMAGILAEQLARRDPRRALEWARSQDSGARPSIELNVLSQIAAVDPALALQEAGALANRHARQQALSGVLSTVAGTDPQRAAAFVDGLTDARDRQTAAMSVMHGWANVDPEAAIDWLLASDLPDASSLLVQTGYSVIARDVDLAVRVLPRLDAGAQRQWATQIASTMASQRGADAAVRFVEGYRGKPGYDDMQSALISNLVQTDPARARRIVDRMPAGIARDRGVEQLIANVGGDETAESLALLDTIGDEATRAQAAGMLTARWMQHDPRAAMQWVEGRPAGAVRDQGILQIVNNPNVSGADIDRLIETLSDPALRERAMLTRVYALAQSDPARARALLDGIEMPAQQRRQMERQLDRFTESATQF